MVSPAARRSRSHRAARAGSALLVAGAGLTATSLAVAGTAAASSPVVQRHVVLSSGLTTGQVKHTWLIILENKSYDATFTGLNQNSYLWKTLPSQGALLQQYYGTSHFSQGNYETLVSGQATNTDLNSDCDVKFQDFKGTVVADRSSPDYGQAAAAVGPYKGLATDPAGDGKNGCVYPASVPTLFNQFDANGTSWKGYAQDLRAVPNREDLACGGVGAAGNDPTTNPTDEQAATKPTGVTTYTRAQPADQYVAKHFPFPWFHSLTDNAADCDATHIAALDDASQGLVHDLQSNNVPAFSWITPNNCSDAHDATCVGNNLSGAFDANGSPVYTSPAPYNPLSTTATNKIGGLYAADLFLKYYIPLIESSQAFKDGGLIDITFDEANPPFTYTGNSFNNATDYAGTSGANATNSDKPDYRTGLAADASQFSIDGVTSTAVPAGPNNPLVINGGTVNAEGHPYPGPGNNAFIDRIPPGARTDVAAAAAGATTVTDNTVSVLDRGRAVTNPTPAAGATAQTSIPAGAFVGAVSDVGPDFVNNRAFNGSFQLVDASGAPLAVTGPVTGVTLAARTAADDPLYDNVDQTPGGGQVGSVLISPFITPGTVSTVSYDHYSWLRTMEDIYDVSTGTSTAAVTGGAGSVSGGLDGLGHLGFAATAGLTTFGRDVFTNVPAAGTASPSAPASPSASASSSATAAVGASATATSPAATALPGLPFTGSSSAGALALAGLGLVGVGAVATVVARRRLKV